MGSLLTKLANKLGSPSLDNPKPGVSNIPKVIKPPQNPPKVPKPPGNKSDDVGMPSTKDVLKDIGKAQRSQEREAKKNPLKRVQGVDETP